MLLQENKDKLKLVAIDEGNGPVNPSLETVSNGTYSPLSRPLFIYVNSKAVAREEVTEFVDFYIANAPALATEVGYVPLPESEYKLQADKFTSFVEGLKHEN